MEFSLDASISLLSRTPAALDALLRSLLPCWIEQSEGQSDGKDTWTVHGVLAHLIHTERNNWIPRAQWLLEFGESRVFAAVDRHASYDRPMHILLEEFAVDRASSLESLNEMHLTAEDLARRGLHSRFGAVTLSQLLATWTVHDMTHLHQISRILAHQYREAVGPWSEFLGVLQCRGHSTF